MKDLLDTLTLYAFPVLLAITLHEAAHGYVAKLFGDPTASLAGRVSLNPIRHIDPIGTIAVPVGILAMSSLFGGGFLFGWAKPVPVNFAALRNPKKDMLWVALAGPASNLLMVFGWAFIAKIALAFPENYYAVPMVEMAKTSRRPPSREILPADRLEPMLKNLLKPGVPRRVRLCSIKAFSPRKLPSPDRKLTVPS